MALQPYRFTPLLKPVIWGGNRLEPLKGLSPSARPIGESWELSGIAGRESVVEGGDDNGLTLNQLIDRHGIELMGQRVMQRYGRQFPLLVKLIDAERDLSIQVHPDDAQAHDLGHQCGKTEMWYVIDHRPGAQIMAGFSDRITREDFDRHVRQDTITDVVAHHASHRGDTYLLPAGCIHALGAGNLVAEIQQASDITFRIHDYGRKDENGRTRTLHVPQAAQALDFSVMGAQVHNPCANRADDTIAQCDHFTVSRHHVNGTLRLQPHDAFMVLVCVEGDAWIAGNPAVAMTAGQTLLLPACMEHATINGKAIILAATLP